MQKDTEPHLWPTWTLSPEEAESFYRGSGRVTLAMDENSGLLGVVYHSRCQTKEALESALAEMRSDFPRAVTLEGSMRGHYFCEDLPDAGWRQVWEDAYWPEPERASPHEERGGEHERER
jgi:hypothetical protein